jgi:hypothetical protein
MKKWELTAIVCDVSGFKTDASRVWTQKYKSTGKSDWDQLSEKAKEAYELVSVTSINSQGYTVQLLYTFKRPIEDGS